MNSTQFRRTATLAGLLVLVPLTALPAAARQDPGTATRTATGAAVRLSCPLERVGTELVRCDLLTGNGVAAPLYIPEQR